MKRFFKIVSVLGVVLAAMLVAVIAILKSQNFNDYRSLIAEQAQAATGRAVTIAGDLELDISLQPALSVEDVTLANAAWGSAPEMARLGRLAAVVELLPLLSGDVRIEWIELSDVDILLETNRNGEGNWIFENAKPDPEAQGADRGGPLPAIESVRLENLALTYRDGVAGTERTFAIERLDLSADGVESPLRVTAKADLNGESISMTGEMGTVSALTGNKIFPIAVDIEAFDASFRLDGTINRPQEATGYNIGFIAKGGSLSDVAARVAVVAGALDETPLAANAFELSGAVRDETGSIAVDGLAATIGDTDLNGNLSFNPASPRLGIVADLRSTRFSIEDVLSETGASGDDQASRPSDGRMFPADPLPFETMRDIDAEVRLNITSANIDGTTLQNVRAALRLYGGRLSLSPFSATYNGNTVTGDVGIDARRSPAAIDASLSGKDIDYGTLIAEFAGDETMKGQLDIDVEVAGAGDSVREIMATLNGDLRLVTEDGRIESGALGFLSSDLLGAVPFLGSVEDDAATLKCAVVDLAIVDGVARPRAMIAETGGLRIVGDGTIDLREETLDLLIDPSAKSASLVSLAEVGVRVGGTFLKPSVSPDGASLAASAASTALGIATGGLSTLAGMALDSVAGRADDTDYCAAAISGKLPQAAPPTDDAGAVTEPQPPQDGTSSVGGALDGLGGALNNLLGN